MPVEDPAMVVSIKALPMFSGISIIFLHNIAPKPVYSRVVLLLLKWRSLTKSCSTIVGNGARLN